MSGSRYEEERLGELLAELPPAPEAWVRAAKELPNLERGLEQVLALAQADAGFRAAMIEDLDGAIRQAGVEPSPEMVHMLRARLDDDPEQGSSG